MAERTIKLGQHHFRLVETKTEVVLYKDRRPFYTNDKTIIKLILSELDIHEVYFPHVDASGFCIPKDEQLW